jgi:hypothetical protein
MKTRNQRKNSPCRKSLKGEGRMRATTSMWLIALAVLIACTGEGGCTRKTSPGGASPEAGSPGATSQVQKTSPEATSRAYLQSLTGGSLDAVWDYDAGYASEITNSLQNLPQAMWKDRTNAIRTEWTQRIQNDRKPTSPGASQCWQLFRPGAKADLLETRENNQSGLAASAWKSFVKVSFPVENDAPIYFSGSGQRRLHDATVIMDIVKSEPPDSVLRISSSCQIIPDGLTLWPVLPLGRDQALAMFKEKSPDGERPRVTLQTTWQVNFSDGMGGRRSADVAAAASLKALFSKYRVVLQNVRDQRDSYFVGGMAMPAAWSTYSLPSAYKNFDTPLPTYALSESVSFSVVELKQTADDQAVARILIAYDGCTPICNLVKEINPIKSSNGDSAATRVLIPPGQQGSGLEWSQQGSREAYYRWDILQGWSLTGVR